MILRFPVNLNGVQCIQPLNRSACFRFFWMESKKCIKTCDRVSGKLKWENSPYWCTCFLEERDLVLGVNLNRSHKSANIGLTNSCECLMFAKKLAKSNGLVTNLPATMANPANLTVSNPRNEPNIWAHLPTRKLGVSRQTLRWFNCNLISRFTWLPSSHELPRHPDYPKHFHKSI